ncbi:transporter substrate-binding domain-containing protein [Acrocarpospora catenulata]|uniref:transporter substrate-binding domain-containing protein n=1 Tax=Acrocarpospora catenulata TaxID=2836182 RepID=UPI001BD9ECDB|nr:transporter substrate-binding domain-containing protein [Acrocarpospora catenulata]
MRRWITALLATTAVVACSGQPTPAATPSPGLSRFHGNPNLRIGTQADQPGLGLYDTTTYLWSGLDVDIANYVMAQLGVPTTPSNPHIYQVLAADREEQLLNNQKDLIIANYSITDGRIQQGITFTVPYLLSYQDILVRGADKDTIRTVDDLRGKRVCAGAEGTTPFHHLSTINQERGLGLVLRPEVGTKVCAEKLNAGEVDAFVSDSAILLGYLTSYPTLHLVGTKVWPRPEQYGIGLVAHSPADVAELNTIIRRMIADGSWKRAIIANFCPQPSDSPCHVAQIFLDSPPPVN